MGLRHEYKEDDVILTEKSKSRFMYLILEGSVALYTNYGTNEEYLYGVLGKGKIFGEIGLLNHEESVYTVVAISTVKVAVFSEFELGNFIREYPDHTLAVMRSIAKMNQIFRMNLEMLMEENKDNLRYRMLYEDAIQQSTGIDRDDIIKWQSPVGDGVAKWRSTIRKKE